MTLLSQIDVSLSLKGKKKEYSTSDKSQEAGSRKMEGIMGADTCT